MNIYNVLDERKQNNVYPFSKFWLYLNENLYVFCKVI